MAAYVPTRFSFELYKENIAKRVLQLSVMICVLELCVMMLNYLIPRFGVDTAENESSRCGVLSYRPRTPSRITYGAMSASAKLAAPTRGMG